MIRRPPRSTLSSSSAASDVYKRQVAGQTVTAREVTDAAAEGEPTDPVGGDDAAGGGQTVPGGRVVEAAPGGAAGSSAESLVRVHRDRPHARQVGNHRAVGGAEAGHAVPAAADRQLAGETGTELAAVSYTHLTLPTKRIV